jgi:GLPGLI family protein
MHKFFSENNMWAENWRKKMPKYFVDQFELRFNKDRAVYILTQEEETPFANRWRVASQNTVYTDFRNKRLSSDKQIYERNYRVEDSIPAYTWKIHGEYREVAGFTCRKASTIILDSLYIIAFYTEQIPVSGGPESFMGLPGMILGMVVPRLNITYFATKVDPRPVEKWLELKDSKKLRKLNRAAFIDELHSDMKDWGEYAGKVMMKAAL